MMMRIPYDGGRGVSTNRGCLNSHRDLLQENLSARRGAGLRDHVWVLEPLRGLLETKEKRAAWCCDSSKIEGGILASWLNVRVIAGLAE
jgi:hypothetical protein